MGCGAQGPGRRAQGGRREGAGRGCTSRLCFDRFDSISFCEGGFDSLFESVRTKPLAHLSVRASCRSFAIFSSFRRTAAARSTQNIVATARNLTGQGAGWNGSGIFFAPRAESAPDQSHPDDLRAVHIDRDDVVPHAAV